MTHDNTTEYENFYCGIWWTEFWDPYDVIHRYVVLIVALIGVVTNALNLVVFTRPTMRNPTNALLAALAISDFLLVFSEVIRRSVNIHRLNHPDTINSYRENVEILIGQIRLLFLHTTSIYLTLMIGIWRVCGVLYPLKVREWWTARNAARAILMSVALSILFVGLEHMGTYVGKESPTSQQYTIKDTEVGLKTQKLVHGLCIKWIPCVLLTVITIVLIRRLLQAKKNSHNLLQGGADVKEDKNVKRDWDRTTKMLIIILVIFLLSEFPPGAFQVAFIFAPGGEDAFHDECIWPILGFLTLMEVLSSSINFFVYLLMSTNFRATMLAILQPSLASPISSPSKSSSV